MIKFITAIFLLSGWHFAFAESTFVGNGGNAGDLELRVSKLILEKTLQDISVSPTIANNLCVCPESYNQYPACKNLEKLSEDQVKFCGQFILDRAATLANSIKNKIVIQWTSQAMTVQENNVLLPVDALANFDTQTIYLNKENFLNLQSYQRNFLLGHELFHLIDWQGSKIVDEQAIGPFSNNTGGRELLNAAAAAVVMHSIRQSIADKHEDDLYRSSHDRDYWISLEYGILKVKEDLNTLYIPDNYSGVQMRFQYALSKNFALGVHYGLYEAEGKFLDTIEAKDEISLYGLGAFYRFFPFDDIYSFKGQSFGSVGLKYEILQGLFKLKEAPLEIEDKTSTNYLTLDFRYYIPMQNGFWLQAGFDVSQPQYQYTKNIDAKYSQLRIISNIGASYAF